MKIEFIRLSHNGLVIDLSPDEARELLEQLKALLEPAPAVSPTWPTQPYVIPYSPQPWFPTTNPGDTTAPWQPPAYPFVTWCANPISTTGKTGEEIKP